MDKEEIIRRLKKISEHAVHVTGEPPFIISLDDGIALGEAVSLLEEQKAKKGHWIVLELCTNEGIYCSECHMKIFDRTTKPKKKLSQYCPHCGSRNDQFFRDGEVVFR